MPEISNCELYKLESKLEELESLVKRMREQVERFKTTPYTLDDDEMDAIRNQIERRP